MNKRANEEVTPNQKRKPEFEDDFGNILRHYIVDYRDNLSDKQVMSLFKRIAIAAIHSSDINNNVVKHYHIVGEAKFTKRQIRDISIARLRAMDVLGGLEAKDFFMTTRIKNIMDRKHYDNTIQYVKRKAERIVFEDPSVQYGPSLHPVFRILDEAEEPKRFSVEEMAEFRRRFPLINSWKKVAAQKRLNKKTIDILQEMECQRKYEEAITPLDGKDFHLLLPNSPLLSHAFNLRNQMISHDQNSGVCMILCGQALTCKSTINRIIAASTGEYNIWPGSQWIQKDPLKFDTAARQGVSTIVVEEMQWIDIQHKITLEKTLTLIKEQLTGAGLDIRLAKTKSTLQDDIKFKLDYLLVSMNETEYVNYRTLSQMINSKPEFRRRFILINMDDPKYSDLVSLRTRSDNNWKSNEER